MEGRWIVSEVKFRRTDDVDRRRRKNWIEVKMIETSLDGLKTWNVIVIRKRRRERVTEREGVSMKTHSKQVMRRRRYDEEGARDNGGRNEERDMRSKRRRGRRSEGNKERGWVGFSYPIRPHNWKSSVNWED